MDTRFLDDLTPGQTFITPGFTLTESEIIDFAWRYDPQAFHLDANAAAESVRQSARSIRSFDSMLRRARYRCAFR